MKRFLNEFFKNVATLAKTVHPQEKELLVHLFESYIHLTCSFSVMGYAASLSSFELMERLEHPNFRPWALCCVEWGK